MKEKARCFGQDLMKGEHILGGGMNKKAIPGGGSGKNSAWLHTQPEGKMLDNRNGNNGEAQGSGTSIFDPVLCELIYRWFSPPGGLVLDPFAGGSVRGIVAAKLGRRYVGVDISTRQIGANREQAATICGDNQPVWHIGDSRDIDTLCPDVQADLVFSCPPYVDLEVYSDDEKDLSTMPYSEFLITYQEIIKKSCNLLKENRFACFVIGEVRDKKGMYYQFVPDTVKAFTACGLKYYNEAILVTAVGSLPIRVGKQFESGRKLGKTHQNVLVFIKGDPKKATADIGLVEFGEISPDTPISEELQ